MSNCLQLDHVSYAYGGEILVLSDVSADFQSRKMQYDHRPVRRPAKRCCRCWPAWTPPLPVVHFEGGHRHIPGYAKHRPEHVSLVFQDPSPDRLPHPERAWLVSTKAVSSRNWV